MNKTSQTLLRLEAALERILCHAPKSISPSRKLSIRAIEVESGLSNGCAYYYPDFIKKVSKLREERITAETTQDERMQLNSKADLIRLKNKFRDENIKLRKLNAMIAADQYRQMCELNEAENRIRMLEETIESLKRQQAELKRKNIHSLSPGVATNEKREKK